MLSSFGYSSKYSSCYEWSIPELSSSLRNSTAGPRPSTVGALWLLTVTALFGLAPLVSAQSPNLTVTSQTNTGSALTGYWVEVTDTSGNVLQSGFTSAQFTLAAGTYVVYAGDYGGYYFNHWSDGVTTRGHQTTIPASGTLALAAVYCPSAGCGGSTIAISSQYQGGGALTGMYVLLQQSGATVATGFTPMSFSTSGNATYTVTVDDYTRAYFYGWSDGCAPRTRAVPTTAGMTALTAIYTSTQQSCSGGSSGNDSITVTASDLRTGAALAGFYIDLRQNNNEIAHGFTPVTFTGLSAGIPYLVVSYWYGSDYFRQYSDGNLQRYQFVTLNSTAGQTSYTLNGLYENVTKAQAATLNVIAKFPNGTQIGTAYDINGYPQHTPGMYLTVTPPGASTPFTATFTGGSILPFTFFDGQTYTVSMGASYNNVYFDHWQDNGNTSPVRAVALSGNTTITAIYVQR